MASPRLAHRAPAACAACYAQYPDRLHVDFGAALEGRLVDPSKPRGGFVDWVIICEKCLRDGVALLPNEERDQVKQVEAQLAAQRERAEKAETYASTLEAALAAREHVHPSVTPAEPAAPKAPRKARYAAGGNS